jgi:hypothetical protein
MRVNKRKLMNGNEVSKKRKGHERKCTEMNENERSK